MGASSTRVLGAIEVLESPLEQGLAFLQEDDPLRAWPQRAIGGGVGHAWTWTKGPEACASTLPWQKPALQGGVGPAGCTGAARQICRCSVRTASPRAPRRSGALQLDRPRAKASIGRLSRRISPSRGPHPW